MITTIVLWTAIAVNVGCAANNFILMRRWQRRIARLPSDDQTMQLIASFAPAVAFCLALRDDPHAPESVRREAARVIPNNDLISVIGEVTGMASSEKVH